MKSIHRQLRNRGELSSIDHRTASCVYHFRENVRDATRKCQDKQTLRLIQFIEKIPHNTGLTEVQLRTMHQ